MFDYVWKCDCGKKGESDTLVRAKALARVHLATHKDKGWKVFIDQSKEKELTDKWWVITK